MKRPVTILAATLLILVAYFCIWPVPVEPESWNAPRSPGYVGDHAVNTRLASLETIGIGSEEGPEHVALAPDGRLYAAMHSGNILRMNPDGSSQGVFVNTGGRVLGFDFDATGNLIAADAYLGLLSVAPNGETTVLTDHVDGDPIRYADAVVVASDGKIYFSDASTRFSPADWGGTFEASILDIVEQSATGRILAYDPSDTSTRVVVRGLSFANGVALSSDEQSLFVAETGRYRVWRVDVSADNVDLARPSTQAEIVLDNLPGFPDNLMRGEDGKIWLGFAKPRNTMVDATADKPLLRKVMLRLPRALWPVPKPYGHVIAFTEDGVIVADLQDPSGAYPETTSVTETDDRLYIHSLHAEGIGWLPK